ncbi:ZP4 protein, partial [Polypterus senegalus]
MAGILGRDESAGWASLRTEAVHLGSAKRGRNSSQQPSGVSKPEWCELKDKTVEETCDGKEKNENLSSRQADQSRRSGSVAERCAVTASEKLPCGGSSSITQADCEANNCCYDSSSSTSPCYYANDVTVQCTLDGQFVVVVSENVTLPALDLGSIQLVDSSSPSCSPVTSLSSFVMYQFPVSTCGSTVQVSGGNVTYQNTMSAAITVRTGPEGSITRDSVYKLFFQCTYSGSQDVQVEAEVYTVAPPLPVVQQGPFDLELVIATDSSYGSYYVDADYPVTKTLRDPVAVEVHILNRTDPNLVLTLGDCWVTPGPSASSQPQWSLLVNGCPYTGDNYLTSLVTVDSTSGVAYPSHYKRFVFEMFAFVDPVAQQALAEKIFIYCVAAACYPSATDPCTQSCFERKTSGGVVNVINNLPGIVLRVIAGRTTLTVPFNSPYGYASDKGSQYVVTIAVGSRSNLKTFTCLKPVTVQCTLDGQFVVVVSEKVTLPPLDLGSIKLVDSSSPSCSPVTSLSSFVMYQFPVSACGSTVQLAGGNVTYQNTMSAAITVRTGPEGSITRDSVYKLFFQCTYSGSQDVQVEAEVYTVAPPLPVVEQGPFDLELVIATDSSYGSYYVDADYPVTKTLRDPVAVEVHIVNRTDPNLVLTLGDCWVTPGPSASSQPQWSLLVNGCPNTGDNYLTSLVTVDSTSGVAYPSHYKRFVFEMFAFVDPVVRQALAEKIFIYCVAAACYPSATDPCTQSCPVRRSGRAADKLAQIAFSRKNVLLHSGPVVFEAEQVQTSKLQDEAVFPTGYLVLGAAAAMLMVVLVLAVVAVRRFNVQKMAGGNVTYQNTMSAAITVRTGPEGSITRDSVYKLFFQCTYSGSQDVQVEAEVYTVVPPLPVVEQGPFDLELVIATDSSYGSYYVDADYPVTKTLRDPVAVEVHIVNRTDPNLVLTLGDCWVTPGPSASSQPQWSLLVNGCPYTGDNYLTSLVTVDSTSGVTYPSHYKRFVFEMFAFVDPVAQQALAEKIFIYCVAAACYPSATDPCTQSCPARRSGRAADKLASISSFRKNVLLHSGPVVFQADQVQTSKLEDEVTVQCTLDGQFVVVVSEKVTLPPLDLGSIKLVDSSSPSCSPVTSLSSFVMYQFPVSACGSTVQVAGGNVMYQNTMSAAITVRSGPEGSITRDSVYKLFFQCTYLGSQDVQVEAEVYTVAPPLPVVEQGPFDLELVIATDSSYGSYYVDADYPVTKTLRDPVAVEVHIMNRTDPNLVLTLGDCWVTPGPSASSQPQWSLLVNGCPYTGDNYLTSLVTVDSTSGVAYPSHYKRFVFEMFAFVDPVAQKALAEKCTLDGQFVVVVSENVTLPPLDLGSIQLVDSSAPSCSPVTSLSSFVMYQFPVSACGSTVQLAGGNVSYQNTMSAAITVRTGPEGSITRDSVYKLFFQCTYSGSQDVQVDAEVYTVAPPLPVVEQGPFDLELVIATDSTYGSYYVDADYPVTKTLRDPVAVEVHIVNRTDPNLVLTLGDCWVTPGPSASSQPQWSLLVNGCPYTGDNYLTSLVTVDSTSGVAYPSHYKRFVFEMFAFVDAVAQQALAEKIFIYCVAAACYPSATDPCIQSCPARKTIGELRLVKVTKDLPGIVLRVKSGRTTLTVPFSSRYGYVVDEVSSADAFALQFIIQLWYLVLRFEPLLSL